MYLTKYTAAHKNTFEVGYETGNLNVQVGKLPIWHSLTLFQYLHAP